MVANPEGLFQSFARFLTGDGRTRSICPSAASDNGRRNGEKFVIKQAFGEERSRTTEGNEVVTQYLVEWTSARDAGECQTPTLWMRQSEGDCLSVQKWPPGQ